MNKLLPPKVTRKIYRVGMKLKKHSPTLFVIGGSIGVFTGFGLAIAATVRAIDVVNDAKEALDTVDEQFADGVPDEETGEVVEPETVKKAIKVKAGLTLVKTYAPAFITTTASVGLMLASHRVLTNRNAGLAAAYAALDQSFKAYRARVIERGGAELDKEYRYDLKATEVPATTTNENGEEVETTKIVNAARPEILRERSDYAMVFDSSCMGWDKNLDYAMNQLAIYERLANDLLQAKGMLFLNEIYDLFQSEKYPRTKAGQIVGWVYNEKNPVGDNYVRFIKDIIHVIPSPDYPDAYEPTIILDFNVDGNVIDLME